MNPDQAKEIFAYALSQEHCVLEFTEKSDGTMRVLDVTDHFNAMEERLND